MAASSNLFRHEALVSRQMRIERMKQRGVTLWLTGLSGSGKSTIAHALDAALFERGQVSYVLDGDNIRMGLNSDLDFSAQDRVENIRRIGEVALLFTDANVITITAFISPYREDRNRIRLLHDKDDFIEIFVDCPLEICEQRDTKELYAKARRGEVANFTGVSAPYEAPENPEIIISTEGQNVETSVTTILNYLENHGIIARI